MPVTASFFRKNMFRLLEEAIRGSAVDIEYKGVTLRVQASSVTTSKLSRMRSRDILLVPAEEIVHGDPEDFQAGSGGAASGKRS